MSGIRVLDVDERGRLLTAVTEGDHSRLIERDPKGGQRDLGSATGLSTAKYLPGERKVVLQHGTPARLSLLRVGGKVAPLLGSPEHATELLGVLPGRIVYRANRRHRLLFTVVIRNVLVGEEQAVYDRGGAVVEAAVSPNSRHIAIRLPRKLVLVDTMPVTEDDHVRLVSAEPAERGRRNLTWLPDSNRLVATEYEPDTARVVRFEVGSESWHPVVSGLSPAAVGLAAPDGRRIAVVAGAHIAFYETEKGRFLREAELPGPGDGFLWSPDSRSVVAGTAIVEAESGAVREIT